MGEAAEPEAPSPVTASGSGGACPTAAITDCLKPEPREMGAGGLHSGNPFKLILVPRHVNRAKEIFEIASGKGFETRIISDPEIPFSELPEVGVFSAVGHLLRLYERCDLAIVCGSFAPGLSGHNPLEPSSVGRPMIFGTNMTSFHEQARALMERAACIMVVRNNIHTVFTEYAKDPHIAKISAQRGRAYVAGLPPVAPKLASAIRGALAAAGDANPETLPQSGTGGGAAPPPGTEGGPQGRAVPSPVTGGGTDSPPGTGNGPDTASDTGSGEIPPGAAHGDSR
jgi:hypothetical protein